MANEVMGGVRRRMVGRAVAGVLVGVALVGVAGGMTSAAMTLKDPFAGRWKVNAVPEGGAKPFADTLTFKGGKMTAEELSRKGWPAADYEDDIRPGGVAQFKCTLTHATEGEMLWTGSITASEIRGTITLRKKGGGDEERFNYSGSKN